MTALAVVMFVVALLLHSLLPARIIINSILLVWNTPVSVEIEQISDEISEYDFMESDYDDYYDADLDEYGDMEYFEDDIE